MEQYSVGPDGEKYLLPTREDESKELERLSALAAEQRAIGREIVVVVGLGFVGSVMAGVVADSEDETGKPGKFVIGMQRPSPRSFWKIHYINKGIPPVKSEDPKVDSMIHRTVVEKKTFVATYTYEAISLADVIVVDVQCDYIKESLGHVENGFADIKALESSLAVIAEKMRPEALVLIETTVPPGTTEQVAYPLMKKIFRKRGIASDPLLAHSYERVMPGRDYVDSIRNFWRVCSGINDEARAKVTKFLNEVLNTKDFPLTVMDKPIESETAKIVENSYRAAMLAFLDEWSLFAERNGVDLIKVIDAIKMRPTHNNIIFPGPGIGGYCLPKDGGLAIWSYKHLLGFEDDIFKMTRTAIDVNDTRALRVAQMTRDALRNMNKPIAAAKILVLGAAYRKDVGDTRYSGSEIIVRRLTEMGAELHVHDPYVEHWWEFESQDNYPATGLSWSRFFRNQEKLKQLRMEADMDTALADSDVVIFAVPHEMYMHVDPEKLVGKIGSPAAIIDCYGILGDDEIKRYFELGCEVKGLGRGHINRIKKSVFQR
ncbi:MAG: nucleotide sugar dehydrogenase [Nitrospirae bacterium]|nr:nucleotide sugar dehydrogenase [Nitrospirota bacterium]